MPFTLSWRSEDPSYLSRNTTGSIWLTIFSRKLLLQQNKRMNSALASQRDFAPSACFSSARYSSLMFLLSTLVLKARLESNRGKKRAAILNVSTSVTSAKHVGIYHFEGDWGEYFPRPSLIGRYSPDREQPIEMPLLFWISRRNMENLNFLEQREEIESLKSIFPSEFAELSSSPPSFMIRLDDLDVQLPSAVPLKITFPANYPTEVPHVEIPNRSNVLPAEILTELLGFIHSVAQDYLGMPMVFSIVSETKDWISKNADRIQRFHASLVEEKAATEQGEREKRDDSHRRPREFVEKSLDFDFGRQQGRWEYVIGLIGE